MAVFHTDIIHCPHCGAPVDLRDLVRRLPCPYCKQDVYPALRQFNTDLYDPPDGPASELLRICSIHLHGENWSRAESTALVAIDLDQGNFLCHLHLLLAQTHSSHVVNLADCDFSFAELTSYRMFARLAPISYLAEIDMYLQDVLDRIGDCEDSCYDSDWEESEDQDDSSQVEEIFLEACELMFRSSSPSDFSRAADLFSSILDYEDAATLRARCVKMASALRTESFMRSFIGGSCAVFLIMFLVVLLSGGLF